jgi:hypothetical protein
VKHATGALMTLLAIFKVCAGSCSCATSVQLNLLQYALCSVPGYCNCCCCCCCADACKHRGPGAGCLTLAAFCRRSPDSPTQMLSTSLDTRISRMGFPALASFCAHHMCLSASANYSRYDQSYTATTTNAGCSDIGTMVQCLAAAESPSNAPPW